MMDTNEIEQAKSALWYGLFPASDETLTFLRESATLENPVEFPHVTFGYKTEVPDGINWNSVYDVHFVGYGNDGECEGYSVALPPELSRFYFGAIVPHVTLSLADGVRAVDTAFIPFDAISVFSLPMKFGYFSRGKFYF